MKTKLLLLSAILVASMPAARAINYYWDANGIAPGAGVTPNGNWGTNDFWNTSGIGGAGTFTNTITAADLAIFSAGTDATGDYTVTVNGTQNAAALYLNFGSNVVLTNGILALTRTNGSSTNVGAVNTGTNMTGTATIASGILLDTSAANTVLHLNAGNGAGATDLRVSGDISASVPATTYLLRLIGAGDGRIEAALTDTNATLGGTIQQGAANWSGTWTIAGNQSLGSVAITLSGENKLVMGDSTANVQSWSGTTTIATNTASLTVRSTATISNATVRGGATLSVGGNLTGATLTLGGTNGLGILQVADGVSGGNATFSAVSSAAAGTKIVGGAGGMGTFTFNLASGASFFPAAIALGGPGTNENNFNFAKAGASTLTFSNAMTYTGATRIATGQLQINSSGSIDPASPVQISNGAALALSRGGAFPLVFSNAIGGAGGVIKTGVGDVTLAASNSHTGGTTISNANSGNLILAANNALGTGPLGIDSSAGVTRLWVNGTTNTVTDFVLAGTNAQVIQNEGSGGSQGRFIVNVSNGVTIQTATNTIIRDRSVATNAALGTLALAKSGAGTLVLRGSSANSGDITIDAGRIEFASTSATGFLIGGSGRNNAVQGTGAATFDGLFLFDLAGASTNTNATWAIVAPAVNETYGTNFLVSGFNGAGGLWTNSTNGVDYVFNQSTGVLSVQSTNAVGNYAGWVAYWQGVASFTNTAPTADPDGDAFANDEEFAFDGNPTVGSPALLTAVKAGTNAVFNFVARKNPPGGVTYQVQGTTNLSAGPWTNSSVTVSNAVNQGGLNIPADYERHEFVVPASGREFYRVEASVE
jgi:autotransporter-associated beta strand protein